MVNKRIPHDGDEEDAFSRAGRLYNWAPGALKAIKKRANKRERRQGNDDISEQLE